MAPWMRCVPVQARPGSSTSDSSSQVSTMSATMKVQAPGALSHSTFLLTVTSLGGRRGEQDSRVVVTMLWGLVSQACSFACTPLG